MFFRVGVCALHTLGRHVVNEPEVVQDVVRHVVNELKVGCHVVSDFKYLKSDFRWIIHLRLYSGPFWAVEYLAWLGRI